MSDFARTLRARCPIDLTRNGGGQVLELKGIRLTSDNRLLATNSVTNSNQPVQPEAEFLSSARAEFERTMSGRISKRDNSSKIHITRSREDRWGCRTHRCCAPRDQRAGASVGVPEQASACRSKRGGAGASVGVPKLATWCRRKFFTATGSLSWWTGFRARSTVARVWQHPPLHVCSDSDATLSFAALQCNQQLSRTRALPQ